MASSYIEYYFKVHPAASGVEILIAELSQLGFESFVEEENGLRAYIQEDADLSSVRILNSSEFVITFSKKEIEQVNWNAEWERNFEPIQVNDQCVVRAPFHESSGVTYEIIIEPKMSFGTGHHETTLMMMRLLFEIELEGKNVLDMGCGTAVLAILAERLGARNIDAVDIDEWSVENSIENAARNDRKRISVWQGDIDSVPTGNRYDVIIANINRNILQRHIPSYHKLLSPKGMLLLSGFYHSDLEVISKDCSEVGLMFDSSMETNDWVAAKFVN